LCEDDQKILPRISLVISLILAFGLSASAVARNSDLDACADSAQGSFMEADVRVLRKGLQIVEGLKPANFAVTLGGVPKQVCKVERSSSPLSIGILLDVSGSMVGKKSDLFGNTAACAGINRHVVRDERALQERKEQIHLGPEFCGEHREVLVEA
jgi:hypothetical protein